MIRAVPAEPSKGVAKEPVSMPNTQIIERDHGLYVRSGRFLE